MIPGGARGYPGMVRRVAAVWSWARYGREVKFLRLGIGIVGVGFGPWLLSGCMFIGDQEHAAFLATLRAGQDDSGADSGVSDSAADTGSLEMRTAPINEVAEVILADGDVTSYGRSLAMGDIDGDGLGYVLAGYVQDDRPCLSVIRTSRFIEPGVPAGSGVGDAWFIGAYGNFAENVPLVLLPDSETPILTGDPQYTRSAVMTGGVWQLAVERGGQNSDVGAIPGEAAGDQAGASMVVGPRSEVAVGAPGAECGAVYVGEWPFEEVASGSLAGEFSTAVFAAGMHKLVVDCSGESDDVQWQDFGRTLVMDDFSGTGELGLVVGAPESESSAGGGGVVYVIPATEALAVESGGEVYLSESGAAYVIHGLDSGARYGASLTSADANGDGAADLVVGEPDGVGEGVYRGGSAYFYFEVAASVADVFSDSAGAVVRGDVEGQLVGTSVVAIKTPLGSADSESVAVGAPGFDSGRGGVLITPVGDMLASGIFSNFTAGFLLTGAEAGDRLGSQLASGDGDLDGLADLLMGTPDAGASGEGAVWLLRGSSL